ISLHLVLFGRTSPAAAFRESARMMQGSRGGLLHRIVVWGLLLWGIKTLLALVAGLLSSGAYALFGDNLAAVALVSVAILGLWLLADAVVMAWGYGALSVLLLDSYTRRTGDTSVPSAPTGAAHRAAGVAALLLAALILAGGGLGVTLDRLDRTTAERTVESIAHRGASAARPENTLAAVERALEERADWVEIDVQETAD
ncbi:unnamed protein product, partial [Ectocarpus sp. 12 AP-2014]